MTTTTTTRPITRPLLTAAALAGPFFYTVAIAQMLTREGFDLSVHPISQLATGSLGWIQMIRTRIVRAGTRPRSARGSP